MLSVKPFVIDDTDLRIGYGNDPQVGDILIFTGSALFPMF